MEQQLFMEALENLKIFARSNGNTVTKRDVSDCIGADIALDDAKWQMIAGYLRTNGITMPEVSIPDMPIAMAQTPEASMSSASRDTRTSDVAAETIPIDMRRLSSDEKKLLEMYLQDLKEIAPLSRATQAVILQDVCEKDVESRAVLINHYLLKVVDWIAPYKGKGAAVMDLIQEANLTVMDELQRRDWMKKLDAFDVMDSSDMADWLDLSERLDKYLLLAIDKALNRIIDEQDTERKAGSVVLSKVNEVNEAANKAYAEYGRKLTVAELADWMKVPEDDIREAVRLSGSTIEAVTE